MEKDKEPLLTEEQIIDLGVEEMRYDFEKRIRQGRRQYGGIEIDVLGLSRGLVAKTPHPFYKFFDDYDLEMDLTEEQAVYLNMLKAEKDADENESE